jgi:hypothetical protein
MQSRRDKTQQNDFDVGADKGKGEQASTQDQGEAITSEWQGHNINLSNDNASISALLLAPIIPKLQSVDWELPALSDREKGRMIDAMAHAVLPFMVSRGYLDTGKRFEFV